MTVGLVDCWTAFLMLTGEKFENWTDFYIENFRNWTVFHRGIFV